MATLVEPPGTSQDFCCVSDNKQFMNYLSIARKDMRSSIIDGAIYLVPQVSKLFGLVLD